MIAAVHARGALGTKANMAYSQFARTSSPPTIYTYISNPKFRNNPFWETLQDVKELF